MRTRNHFVGLWLDDKECAQLMKQCADTGLTASSVIRQAIMGIQLRPRPPDASAALLRELSAIGNNANQIAYWANARKSISEAELREAISLIRQAERLVKESL